jgi:hypothetical protein
LRPRALASMLLLLGACTSDSDIVVEDKPGPDCGTAARLRRRGYPPSLEVLFTESCTVRRWPNVNEADIAKLSAGQRTPWKTCDTFVEVPLWTEEDAAGNVIAIHFCPDTCAGLREKLKGQLKQDVVCEPGAGAGGASGASTGAPASGAGGMAPAVVPPIAGAAGS